MKIRYLPVLFISLVFAIAGRAEPAPELSRGLGKAQTILALRNMGIDGVRIGVYPQRAVRTHEEIQRLQDAEGIRIVLPAGGVRAGFQGESIGYLQVAPSLPEFHQKLANVTTRAQALTVLQSMLKDGRQFVVHSAPFRDALVSFSALGAAEHALLEKYDQWTANEKAWIGYWYLTLHFQAGQLVEIDRSWSLGPK